MSAPDLSATLLDYPWVLIRFRCAACQRAGDTRLAACAAKFGPELTMGELLQRWRSKCPRNPAARFRKPQKYGMRCVGTIVDLGRSGPPDEPPGPGAWSVIEGGRS